MKSVRCLRPHVPLKKEKKSDKLGRSWGVGGGVRGGGVNTDVNTLLMLLLRLEQTLRPACSSHYTTGGSRKGD